MEKRIIWRGLVAGAIGGLLAFVFARIFAEPRIQRAVDYEEGREHAQQALDRAAGVLSGHSHDDPFSRAVQANVGIGVSMIFFGAAMGGLFAVAYAMYLGRSGRLRPGTLALLVAGGGFLGSYAVPFLKYPANPPAIGHEETIGQRSSFYLLMVAASVLLLVISVWLGRRLRARFGSWNATLLAGAVFVAAVGLVMLLLPAVGDMPGNEAYQAATETPGPLTDANGAIVFPGFPADLLYEFRLYSIGAQLILWAAIGLIFAPLAERLLAPTTHRPTPEPAVAIG
jgi:putative cobalt transporter subunit CbtA